MYQTKFTIRENTTLSMEDYEKLYNRKPELLKLTFNTRSRDYHEYAKGEEAFFGENNAYKVTMISLMSELRSVYQKAVDTHLSKKERRDFSNEIKPIVAKIEKHIEKTFNIHKCYFGLIDDMNAWCMPLCWDKNLAKKDDKKYKVNTKLKVSLEDIVETKNGYKYKEPDGKIYCVAFGIHFFDRKNKKDIYTDEECAAVVTHELGHAMQQAVCSINENMASVYIHSLFEDVYNCLNPILTLFTLGISPLVAISKNKQYKEIRDDDPEYVGDQIIKTVIAGHQKDFDRETLGSYMDNETDDISRHLPNKSNGKVKKFFAKFFSFTLGGLIRIIDELLSSILSVPQNIYVASQNNFLKKNRRFEQFADIYTAAYGLGPAQASALAKLGNTYGFKQDYGVLSILNYVPVLNIITGVSHYTRESINQLVAGYPDTTGRMAAIYKSLKNDLDNNKDLSSEDKKEIQAQIDRMNDTYNEYVYDWSPKGFVYALWHKCTFKSLKNTKSDAQTNVLEALEEIQKENRFKNAGKQVNKNNKEVEVDSDKLMSAMLKTMKNLKTNYGSATKEIVDKIEPELRSI